MSRINRARIVDGDQATAASLNDRFDDFSQANALDRFNLRDAAVDLPQLAKSPDFQAPFVQVDNIGKVDLLHASPVSVTGFTSSPYTNPHIVEDGAGNPTFATYTGGLSITPGQVLRIYWSLSVDVDISAFPYRGGIQFNQIKHSSGTTDVSTSAGCFVAWLQWDITSSALGAWTEVPGQGDFKTQFGSYYGNMLSNCRATTVIPLWAHWSTSLDDGEPSSSGMDARTMGWRGISGAWHYNSATTFTVYGLRVVMLGVMHPNRVSVATPNNLVLDPAIGSNVTFEYTGGQLVTFLNRVK